MSQALLSLIIFGLFILIFIWDKLPMATSAILGCVVMVILGLSNFNTAFGQFASTTVILLIGVMVVGSALAETGVPAWLHPVFDARKPDNNLVFSWEYELSQAMLQMVQADLFQEFPSLKVIVHHAGGMAPFFAGRIDRILPPAQAEDFRRFYVDTAILGNPRALDLAVDFFGEDHVVFGTDAPLGILPAGATREISQAIEDMHVSDDVKQAIFEDNYRRLLQL